jgi:uncharacterized protein YndB with AHSA1/START domain
MTAISVSTTIAAGPEAVWAAIEDVSTHVRWMADAVAIRFTTAARTGVGAAFDCDTKVGPLRLTDRMEVTEWDPPHAMGMRHVGVVTGSGRFTLERASAGTTFTWTEDLAFPRWAGGPVAGVAVAPVLRRVWRRNLAGLKALVEQGPTPGV